MIRICINHLCGLFFGVLVSAPRLLARVLLEKIKLTCVQITSSFNLTIYIFYSERRRGRERRQSGSIMVQKVAVRL